MKNVTEFLINNKKSDLIYNSNLIKQINENELQISFSSHFEDLIIKRIFPKSKSFFYVDVGANSPFINSNTAMFYLNGSYGINIDAQEKIINELNIYRKKDKNILSLVHSSETMLDFNYHQIPSRSSSSKEFIRLSKIGVNKSGGRTKILKKKTNTLNNILDENNCPNKFNLLNIDVEGSELDVLRGLNLKKYKPKLIVVETSPPYDLKKKLKKNFRNDNRKIFNYLKKFGYIVLYFDRVNTWFCKKTSYKSYFNKIKQPLSKTIDNFITFSHYQSLVNKKDLEIKKLRK